MTRPTAFVGRRLAGVVLAATVVISGCVTPADSSDEAIATAAPVGGWNIDPWGDGYSRVVVQWTPDGVPPATGEMTSLRTQSFEPVDPDHPLAGNGGTPGGSGEGTGGDSGPATTTSTTTTTTAPGVGDGHPLLAEAGVIEVNEVGTDLYQVVTELDEETVAGLPGVVRAWEEPVAAISADPDQGLQWYLANDGLSPARGSAGADAGAAAAWAESTGAGVVVAVIDTGVQLDHPDLTGRLWTNDDEICGNGVDDDANGYVDDCSGWDFSDDDGSIADTNGHGTHIAGTIAAEADNGIGIAGVAPDARIMPVRISTGASFGLAVTPRAIDYAVDNGADILNLSWGTGPGTPINAYPPLADAIERARQAGVLVMVAAGNSGVNIDDRPVIPASYPHDNLVTVGASTSSDGNAGFSNFGVRSVEIFAPGDNIWATVPGSGYGWKSGTSMASPVAAGVAALLWAADPSASYLEVRDALLDGATEIGSLGRLASSGARVDAPDSLLLIAPAVSFVVDGLGSLVPGGPQSVVVRPAIDDDEPVPAGPFALRTTLLAVYQEQVYALSGHDVGVDGAPVTSDDAGQVLSSSTTDPSAPIDLDLGLPAGEYGLLFELVAGDATEPVGPAGLVGFTVGAPTSPTTEPIGGDPGAPTTTVATPIDPGAPTTLPSSPTTTPGGGGGSPTPTTAPGGAGSPTPTTSPGEASPTPTTVPTTAPGGAGSPTPTTAPGGGGSPSPTTAPGAGGTPSPTTAPGGGGSPIPTTAPGDASPTPTTAPTTAPGDGNPTPTTTPGGGSAPTTTAPPLEVIGDLRLTGMNPRSGSVTGGEIVTITGQGIGPRPAVRFGDNGAQILAVISGVQLVVIAPAGSPGIVDVTVTTANGRSGAMIGAYTYNDGSTTVPTTTPVVTPTNPPGGGADPGTTPDPTPTTQPGSAPPPTTPPSTPGGGTDPGTTPDPTPTTQPGTAPPPTDQPGGDPGTAPTSTPGDRTITTPDGLVLRPIGDGATSRGISLAALRAAACTSTSCRADPA